VLIIKSAEASLLPCYADSIHDISYNNQIKVVMIVIVMVTMSYDDDYVDDDDDEFEYDDNMILMKLIMVMIYGLLFIILKYSS